MRRNSAPGMGGPARAARALVVPMLILALLGGCQIDKATGSYQEGSFNAARNSAQVILNRKTGGISPVSKGVGSWISREALAVFGWSEFMLGNLAAAERAFNDLGRQDRNSFDASLGLAWVHIKRGAHGRAEVHLDAAERKGEKYLKYLVVDARGWNALGMGDIDRAEDNFNREDESYVEYQNEADEAQVGHGWVALTRGRLGDAETAFRAGIERAEDPSEAGCFLCYDGLAEVALARGDTEAAVDAIQNALALSEDFPKLIATLERVLQRIKDPVRRKRILVKLGKAHPANAVFMAKLGWVQIETGETAAARNSFNQALAIAPDEGLARSGLEHLTTMAATAGWTPYHRGEYRRALRACTRLAPRLNRAGSPAAQDCRGWSLYRLGRAALARKAFMEALRIRPGFGSSARGLKDAEAVLLKDYRAAWPMIMSRRLNEAHRALERARKTIPADLAWRIGEAKGWIAYFEGRRGAAKIAFSKALAQRPGAALARVGRGYLAADRGEMETAEGIFREIAERGQSAPAAGYVLAARRLMSGGRPETARAVLAAGAEGHPGSAEIALASAKLHKSLGEFDAAADSLVRAAQLAPDLAAPHLNRIGLDPGAIRDAYIAVAWAAFFAGRNREAVRRFNQYLAAGGEQPNARRGRGFATFRLNRTAEALNDLVFAASFEDAGLRPVVERVLIPGTGKKWRIAYSARSTLGWAYLRLRRYANAERAFRAVLGDHPDWVDAHAGLGYTLLARNRTKASRAAFRNALKREPAYPDALRGIRLAGGRS